MDNDSSSDMDSGTTIAIEDLELAVPTVSADDESQGLVDGGGDEDNDKVDDTTSSSNASNDQANDVEMTDASTLHEHAMEVDAQATEGNQEVVGDKESVHSASAVKSHEATATESGKSPESKGEDFTVQDLNVDLEDVMDIALLVDLFKSSKSAGDQFENKEIVFFSGGTGAGKVRSHSLIDPFWFLNSCSSTSPTSSLVDNHDSVSCRYKV